jgi:hypothetical protein
LEAKTLSPSSSSLQTLLTQFQTLYPMGSLTSELLTVHQDQYAVRAVVQVGSLVLSTGMAAASDIEHAEDRAKVRALEGLISQSPFPAAPPLLPQTSLSTTAPPISPEPPGIPVQPQTLNDRLAAVGLSLDTSGGTAKLSQVAPSDSPLPRVALATEPVLETLTPSSPPSSPLASAQEPVVADWYSHINVEDEEILHTSSSPIPTEPVATPPPASSQPTPSGKPRLKNESQPNSKPIATEFVDLSDVIAQTDVELARLGWTKTQGREHLKRAYGKRSRQELDETELYDFLHYLESQP